MTLKLDKQKIEILIKEMWDAVNSISQGNPQKKFFVHQATVAENKMRRELFRQEAQEVFCTN